MIRSNNVFPSVHGVINYGASDNLDLYIIGGSLM